LHIIRARDRARNAHAARGAQKRCVAIARRAARSRLATHSAGRVTATVDVTLARVLHAVAARRRRVTRRLERAGRSIDVDEGATRCTAKGREHIDGAAPGHTNTRSGGTVEQSTTKQAQLSEAQWSKAQRDEMKLDEARSHGSR
jgi:hypothetical protein